ncbi:hypothetical protein GUJ93_ZPchr0011g27784 [Zizania palustris]|uniref:Uncharacterized protein n=1 Tax=Zizania palustris TaxID=103762 RepID=A0A8J5WHF2_ZIZPA|nr:hypothetical protein GUJ93_ZPchr0011g27784 [Zizania palustris]
MSSASVASCRCASPRNSAGLHAALAPLTLFRPHRPLAPPASHTADHLKPHLPSVAPFASAALCICAAPRNSTSLHAALVSSTLFHMHHPLAPLTSHTAGHLESSLLSTVSLAGTPSYASLLVYSDSVGSAPLHVAAIQEGPHNVQFKGLPI